jgi:hypothetical protein
MADIMCGIVNDVDMRKADHTNNEQAQTHCEDSLNDDVNALGGNRQMSGVGLLHVKLLRTWDRF